MKREIVQGVFIESQGGQRTKFSLTDKFRAALDDDDLDSEQQMCYTLIYEIKECIRNAALTQQPIWIEVDVDFFIEDLEDYVNMLTQIALALADEETVRYSLVGLQGTTITLAKNPELVQSIQEILSLIPQSRPIIFQTR